MSSLWQEVLWAIVLFSIGGAMLWSVYHPDEWLDWYEGATGIDQRRLISDPDTFASNRMRCMQVVGIAMIAFGMFCTYLAFTHQSRADEQRRFLERMEKSLEHSRWRVPPPTE